MNTFNWGDNIIDSRDIIDRFEELDEYYADLKVEVEYVAEELESLQNDYAESTDDSESVEDCNNELHRLSEELKDSNVRLGEWENDNLEEYELLQEILQQGEDAPDWPYGETLIHEKYFTQYIKELIDDCYEMLKEFNEGKWPWNHMTMDWEGAADDAKADYLTIEADGQTYYIRG